MKEDLFTTSFIPTLRRIAESGECTQRDKEELASVFVVPIEDIEHADIPSKIKIKDGELVVVEDITISPQTIDTACLGEMPKCIQGMRDIIISDHMIAITFDGYVMDTYMPGMVERGWVTLIQKRV